MVDLTQNSVLLDNEATIKDYAADLVSLLAHVNSLLPAFMSAKLQGSDPYQINIVCKCTIGTNMGTLNVSELTRANIDAKVAEAIANTFNRCNNTHPKGYSI